MTLDRQLDIFRAPKRNSRHWKPGTVTWGEILSWMENPAPEKDCGNYLLGKLAKTTVDHDKDTVDCTNFHRRATAMVSRSAVTLDSDSPGEDFLDICDIMLGCVGIIHTTHSSTPDAPRYRVILPTDRDMTPEEYHAVASSLMERIGKHHFDAGSVQPERYMFMPAASRPDWFSHVVLEGEALAVDDILKDWTPNAGLLPAPRAHSNKRDPFTLEGVVGAFNRAYDIEDVIREYDLPYVPAGDRRWQLAGAHAEAGVSLVADGLVYSHHATDPAGGQTCSAFDLVRLHRFGELDESISPQTPVNRRPSQNAMLDLASTDARVIAEIVGVDFSKAMDDVADGISGDDWKLRLRLSPRTGKFIDCIENWDLVREHDQTFMCLYFNELTMSVEVDADLPWRPLSRGGATFNDTDRSSLAHYLERVYKIRAPRSLLDELINTTAHQRYVQPVRDYLEALKWDGVARLEECLPGVVPTDYTRTVARKCLAAAVARAMEPGIKWDHTMIFFGDEGLGKTYWMEKMSRGWIAALGRVGDKDTLLTLHRSWIIYADEGYSLRKADSDVMKEFLTRTEDVFRRPFERETLAHKRSCVIWGSTNDEVFLRRQEGNRRFLIVHCESKVDFEALTDEYVDQVWAEAVHIWRSGERLFLDETQGAVAAVVREQFTEEDALAGVIENYLDTLVPKGWDEMSPDARVSWMTNRADGFVAVGTERQTRTCSAQLWVEALGRRFGDHKRSDLLEINTALKRLPGWAAMPGRHRIANYGSQLVFTRDDQDLL